MAVWGQTVLRVGLLVMLAQPAWAETFLTPAQVDLMVLLPPPPADGSAAQIADMAEVLRLQEARTPEQAAQALDDSRQTVFAEFGALLGPAITPAAVPLTAALFARIGDTEDAVADGAKAQFHRTRPPVTNAAIHPAVPVPKSGSWPSGHAVRVTISAIVLAKMLPELRDAIFTRAAAYAENRVIGGAHYPSDIVMGVRAGTAIAAVLLADPAFRAAAGPARAELRQAMNLP